MCNKTLPILFATPFAVVAIEHNIVTITIVIECRSVVVSGVGRNVRAENLLISSQLDGLTYLAFSLGPSLT